MDKELKFIDCFGEICPIPVIRIKRELDLASSGDSFMIATDHSCVVESMKDVYKNRKDVEIHTEEVMMSLGDYFYKAIISQQKLFVPVLVNQFIN